MLLRDVKRYGTTNIFVDHKLQAQSAPALPADPLDSARQCLHFEPDPKQAEILASGELLAPVGRQEFECEFVDPDEALFSTELILRSIPHDVDPLRALAKCCDA